MALNRLCPGEAVTYGAWHLARDAGLPTCWKIPRKTLDFRHAQTPHEEIASRRVSKEKHGECRTPAHFRLARQYQESVQRRVNLPNIGRGIYPAPLPYGYTPKPPRKEIEKTALGATETVPWSHFTDPLDAVRAARDAGARICVLEQTTQSVPYYRITPSDFPLCLVVGNELTGISPAVVAAADMALEIPMFGTKHSLNAAVAYGIAIFDLVRIWKESQAAPR